MVEKKNRISKKSISPEFIIGVAGLFTSFSTILGLLIVFPGDATLFAGCVPASAVVSLAAAAMLLVVSVFQEQIACAKRPVLVYIELVGIVSVAFVWIAGLDRPLSIAFVLISAFGASCLACTWFCWLCAQPSARAKVLIGAACLCACVVCFFEDNLGEDALSAAVICATYAVSAITALVIRRYGVTVNRFPYVSNKESDSRSKILPESTVKFSLDSFQFGMVIGVGCAVGCESLCLLCGVGVAALYLLDATRGRFITERNMAMYVSPLATGAVLCLFLFGQTGQVVALCLLSCAYILITCVGWMAMVGHVNISRLSPLRIFSKARRIQYCIMAIGIMVGFALLRLSFEGVEGWVGSVRITSIIGIVLVFAFSILHRSRFPEAGLEKDGDDAIIEQSASWLKRCRAFADANDLSERQREVLLLIAQGRNAKYVQQKLSISLSTAQTHIRNIYRKAGCHSKQELLDEIAKTKLYGEE